MKSRIAFAAARPRKAESLEAQERRAEVGERDAPAADLIPRVDGEVERLVAGHRGRGRPDRLAVDVPALARRDAPAGEDLLDRRRAGAQIGAGDPVRELRERGRRARRGLRPECQQRGGDFSEDGCE